MSVVVAVQSSYIPWRGYFDLIRQADKFVFLDSVQFTSRSWRNRNYLRSREGRLLLSVPVKKRRAAIREIEIDYSHRWRRQQLRSFYQCYAHAPFRDAVLEILQTAFDEEPRLLMTLNRNLTKLLWAFATNGMEKCFIGDEELNIDHKNGPNERLISLCRELGATTYLSGPTAGVYVDRGRWLASGIELRYIDYAYAPYKQLFEPFEPFVSIVDALANLGAGCLESLLQHPVGDSDRELAADPVLPQNGPA